MRLSNLGVLVVLTPVAVGMPALGCAWEECQVRERRQAVADAAGASVVHVEAKAGSLRIIGEEGLGEVRAQGEACAPNRRALEKVQLRAERAGEEVRVVVDVPEGWGAGGALDLELRVPARLAIAVKDGSGGIEVDGVASLQVVDGSGEIEVSDVGGDVEIHDGSGDIDVVDVEGSVEVEDGSGGIELEDVRGGVLVRDGSGSMEIRGVGRNVVIERDGGGGVEVEDVGGDLVVERKGGGHVSHERVQGQVRVPDR